MDEVDVEVLRLELGEGQVEVGLDELGAVRVVPQLGDEDDFLARDSGLGDTVGDLSQISTVGHRTGRSGFVSLRSGSLRFAQRISMMTRHYPRVTGLTVDLIRSARVVWSHGRHRLTRAQSMCRYPTLRAVATLLAQFQLQLDEQQQRNAFCAGLTPSRPHRGQPATYRNQFGGP